jgi:hypothetical protein
MTSCARCGQDMKVNEELGLRPSLLDPKKRVQHGQRSSEEHNGKLW